MPLVKNATTSLAQGVSQQAESQRYPSQASEQINAYSSPIKGLIKRPPTKFITKTDLATDDKSFIHTINRDSDEQYVLAIDKTTDVAVSGVSAGNNTITLASALPVNTPVRFVSTEEEGELPTGIEAQQTYYTTTANATTGLSDTSGGSAINIGKATINRLEIESVRHTDGRWIDGVIAVTFTAGHGLQAGDVINIDGLSGDSALMVPSDQEFVLRKPAADMAKVNNSNEALTFAADKFLLGRIGGEGNSYNDNLGYAVDDQWVKDGDDDGWNAFGTDVHWALYNGSTLLGDITGNNFVDRIRYNSTSSIVAKFNTGGELENWDSDLDHFEIGDLIRLGSSRRQDKAIRVKITSISGPHTDHLGNTNSYDLHFDQVNVLDLVDSASDASYSGTGTPPNPPWVFMAYWGDTTSTIPASPSNPRQLQNPQSGVTIGTNDSWGAFKAVTGGIRVYDLASGAEKTVNVDGGLEYLNNTTNPSSDLKAVTIADYTFIVNKNNTVARDPVPKYKQQHEAIITVRTADYGKNYTVKIGNEVNKEYSASATKAQFEITGRDSEGKAAVLGRIEAKNSGTDLNGYQIRLIQNWQYTHKGRIVPTRLNPSGAGQEGFSEYRDLLPPQAHRINEYVAIEWVGKTINIWCNFHWANSDVVKGKLTTWDHLTKAIASSSLSDKFQAIKTHSDAAASLTFDKIYLGARGKQETSIYKLTASYGKSHNLKWWHGADESIGTFTGGQSLFGHYVAPLVEKEGYLSPSASTQVTVRRAWIDKGTKQTLQNASLLYGTRYVENGEFFYKSPKWTGTETQKAIGTEKIATMLASDAIYKEGAKFNNSAPAAVQANGLPVPYPLEPAAKEDCVGLSMKYGTTGRLANFAGAGRIDGAESNWSVLQQGYTIAIRNPEGSKFAIQVSDDLGGNGLKLTYFEVDEAADLPNVCRHGHIVKVVGDPREDADDYYLRFEADVENYHELQHGRWVECVAPDVPYQFDANTMPVGLVKESDGSFTLKPLSWDTRNAGDDQSNPFPSFINNSIDDIFLFRNRLGFLSGEDVIFSEAGEYFNFFRTTAAALLDTAPIGVTASTNKVSHLHSAVPYNERLLLFSDQTQFVLDADPFLSPTTVKLSAANEIDNFRVKPVVSGDSVYYGFQRSDFSGVGEIGVSREDSSLMEVNDATAHIPKYIEGTVLKVAAATNEDAFCLITEPSDKTAVPATLYVYKYFNNANRQRVQSAWFKYTFGSNGDFINDISFIGNRLYMLIRRSNVVYLESLTFEDNAKDASMDYEVLLDHRWSKPANNAGITYGNTTTITLPTGYVVTAATRLVTQDSAAYSSTSVGSNTFTVGVNLTGKDFHIGVPYTLEYQFSQPFLKSDKIKETGRYQIQRAYLEYANARSFTVDVVHNPTMIAPNKVTITNQFATTPLHHVLTGTAELEAGSFKFGIQERNDRLQLVLKNDTPYPSDFLSIDYEARAFSRGSRWKG